ncbi:MAG: MerR family transcriptional regulator [Pseudomonadota bacterium]
MSKSAGAFRTISEVAEWLGVQTHVLRFWESKFTQVRPVKRAGGRRYYRPADMLLLGGIRKLLHDDGLTIKGVQKILREQGMAAVADLSQPLDDIEVDGVTAPVADPAPAPTPSASVTQLPLPGTEAPPAPTVPAEATLEAAEQPEPQEDKVVEIAATPDRTEAKIPEPFDAAPDSPSDPSLDEGSEAAVADETNLVADDAATKTADAEPAAPTASPSDPAPVADDADAPPPDRAPDDGPVLPSFLRRPEDRAPALAFTEADITEPPRSDTLEVPPGLMARLAFAPQMSAEARAEAAPLVRRLAAAAGRMHAG